MEIIIFVLFLLAIFILNASSKRDYEIKRIQLWVYVI